MSEFEFWKDLGNIFDAILNYQKKNVEFNTRFINPWIRLGNVFERQDQHNEAVQAYQHAVEIDPDSAQNWINLGDAQFKNGAYDDAAISYQNAINLDPQSGWPISNLAMVLVTQGKYEEAIPLYTASISLLDEDKDKAISWNRLGNVYRKLNDYENAFLAFQRADELDSENTGFNDNLDEAPPTPAVVAPEEILEQLIVEQQIDHAESSAVSEAVVEEPVVALAPNMEMIVEEEITAEEEIAEITSESAVEEVAESIVEPVAEEIIEAAEETAIAETVEEVITELAVEEEVSEPAAEIATEEVAEEVTEAAAEEPVVEAVTEPALEEVSEIAAEETVEEVAIEEAVAEPALEEVSEIAAEETVEEVAIEEAVAEPALEEVSEVAAEETVEEPVTVEEVVAEIEVAPVAEEAVVERRSSVLQLIEDVIAKVEAAAGFGEKAEAVEETVVEEAVEEVEAPRVPSWLIINDKAMIEKAIAEGEELVNAAEMESEAASIDSVTTISDVPQQVAVSESSINMDIVETYTEPVAAPLSEESAVSEETVEEVIEQVVAETEPTLEVEEVFTQTQSTLPEEVAAVDESADVLSEDEMTEAAYEEYLKDVVEPTNILTDHVDEISEAPLTKVSKDGEVRIAMDTKNAHVWNELGNVYLNAGSYDDAIASYGKALELDRQFAWPYSNLALAYVQKGRFAEAILLYQRGIELFTSDKDKAVTWNRLGNVYRRMNDYDNAIAAYQTADELDPENATLSLRSNFGLLGNIYNEQKPAYIA
jgi:tetratricopeptide (TPR) repeat protein